MATTLECFPPHYASRSYTSDSDLELPQLSRSQTETENDTPPETPLRSRIPLDMTGVEYGLKKSDNHILDGTDAIGCRGAVPPPACIFQPLSLVTPNPTRPSLHYFHSFGIDNDEEDCGYDSEREGRGVARPTLSRFRTFRRGAEDTSSVNYGGSKVDIKQPGFSLISKEAHDLVPSPLSTPKLDGKQFQDGSPSLPKRPRHPSPIEHSLLDSAPQFTALDEGLVMQNADVESTRGALSSIREMLATLDLDQEALKLGLSGMGVPIRVQKDRRNTVTGLGLGRPSTLEEDNWRIPTVVPAAATSESRCMIFYSNLIRVLWL